MRQDAKPRRRPSEGGYARGDEKRVQIIEAALRVFGQHGYERASTRLIAQEAGVNPPALQYYFESKAGLELACAEHISAQMEQALEPAYATAALVVGADDAVVAMCGILDALAEFLFGTPLVDDWLRFLARRQGESGGPSTSHLRDRVARRLHRECARLVGLTLGREAGDPLTRVRTIAITGQLTTFHLSRSNSLQQLEWPDFAGERLAMVKRVVREHTMAILGAPREVPGRELTGG